MPAEVTNAGAGDYDIPTQSAPYVAVNPAVNSRPVPLEANSASFIVTTPDAQEGRKLRGFQRRFRAGGAKDHADVVAAGAIDRIPKRGDLFRRHPVLRVQQHHGIDLACRKAFQEQPKIGVDWNDQSRAVAHAFKLATLQIRRQTAVAGTPVTAMQRLPRKIIRLVGVTIDQAQQPLMKHFVKRRARSQQGALLGRNTEAEQQSGGAGYQTSQRRMKQAMQTIQRLNAFGSVFSSVQQRLKIDPCEFRQQMGKADKAAEHAVAVEAVGEIGVSRTSDDVALVPVSARIGIEHRPQPPVIKFGVGGRGALAKKLPEVGVSREGAQARELELEQRKVRLIEVDGVTLRRLRREIG